MEIVVVIAVLLIAIIGLVGAGTVTRRRRQIDSEPSALEDLPPTAPVLPEAGIEAAPGAPRERLVRPAFKDRLGRARSTLSGYVGSITGRSQLTDETWAELEEALIRADVGVTATTALLDELRLTAKQDALQNGEQLLDALKDKLVASLSSGEHGLKLEKQPGSPTVWLFVGVNGVGKTTAIGKVAARQVDEGNTVVLAAADTFRAAAADQLGMWGDRSGTEVIRGSEGSDPGAVVFDAVERAAARGIDLVLADTAGRLQNKVNLMNELDKVRRIAQRPPARLQEVLLVLDATTGQNGLSQAKVFTESAGVTGVVLTKLDGTAKGGIVVAIQSELGIPVKLVGLGEGMEDLVAFDAREYVEALFS